MMKDVIILIGTGAIGLGITRRVSKEKHLLLGDLHKENAERALQDLNHSNSAAESVDVTSRSSIRALIDKASSYGPISGVIHAAGVSPSQSSPSMILKVDLYGTALVLEEFRDAITQGGSCIVISSQAGHQINPLSQKEEKALAMTPADNLLDLPMLQEENFSNSHDAYKLAKKGCSLRVRAEALYWGKKKARINTISPGVINTPMADKELKGPRGDRYQELISSCPLGRAGNVEEIGRLGEFLMGPEGSFITGSDFLIDGGMTSSYWYGNLL